MSQVQGAPLKALFVSDLHLDAALPATTERFLRFLQETAPQAEALYLLGDIFEAWVGDDDNSPFNLKVAQALAALSQKNVALYWMAGNRDFLVGRDFARAAHVTLLDDPHTLTLAGQRLVLTHGDALCTDDHAYMAFRRQVRDPAWQAQFLARPLAERRKIAQDMRSQSRQSQREKAADIMDVNPQEVEKLFAASGAAIMVQGHTHRPARHEHAGGRVRHVLPDWDLDHGQARGGWLALDADGAFKVESFS
jgi:UDP-2,3-diacylglucosamine hydrolase